MTDQAVAKNKVVFITYSIVDESGDVVEQRDMPVGYVHGCNSGIFEQVESALEGAVVGDNVEVTLPPAQGFGPHDPALCFTDDIENVPPEFRYVGAEIEFQNENDETMMFRVSRIEGDKLTVDANHPFAGKTVKFIVDVVSVRDASMDEIVSGMPADAQPMH
jgi:FKBP-type peptidyl-prolyl cis-trans isomerase SlyD